MTTALVDGPTVAHVLQRVVDSALELVPAADLASITLRSPDGGFQTPILSHEIARELDQIQYELQEGPCLEAARDTGPATAMSDDLAVEPSWPRFGPAAVERGMRSVVAIALLPDAVPPRLSGALNLYSRRVGGLSRSDLDVVLVLASHASLALASTEASTLQELELVQLHQAIDSRDVIGQAKGILMERRGISADEAFDMLRDLSQRLNVKLADIARTLTDRHAELDARKP